MRGLRFSCNLSNENSKQPSQPAKRQIDKRFGQLEPNPMTDLITSNMAHEFRLAPEDTR
jgi:hypothetical protein